MGVGGIIRNSTQRQLVTCSESNQLRAPATLVKGITTGHLIPQELLIQTTFTPACLPVSRRAAREGKFTVRLLFPLLARISNASQSKLTRARKPGDLGRHSFKETHDCQEER